MENLKEQVSKIKAKKFDRPSEPDYGLKNAFNLAHPIVELNGERVWYTEAKNKEGVKCIQCSEGLSFVKSHKKLGKIVRGHFKHSGSTCDLSYSRGQGSIKDPGEYDLMITQGIILKSRHSLSQSLKLRCVDKNLKSVIFKFSYLKKEGTIIPFQYDKIKKMFETAPQTTNEFPENLIGSKMRVKLKEAENKKYGYNLELDKIY